MKQCFLFGHREADERICPSISAAVERRILEYGVGEFIVGHYGGFDRQAKRAVLRIKRDYPVRLTLLLPYHPAPNEVFPDFDGTLYPFDGYVPPKAAIIRANRQMIDACACAIAYARHPDLSRDLLDYARLRNKAIIEI